MFASPIVYPASLVPEKYQLIYAINPMVGVIEGFRSALLGTVAFPTLMILISVTVSLILFILGMFYFKQMERYFADIIWRSQMAGSKEQGAKSREKRLRKQRERAHGLGTGARLESCKERIWPIKTPNKKTGKMFRFKDLEIWKKAIEIGDKLLDIADDLEKRKLLCPLPHAPCLLQGIRLCLTML